MIIVALKLDHTAAVVDPSPIAQGTDSENVVLLSPFPVRCPVMMGWVMPDGSPVEIPLDDTENSPKTRYWNMTNIVLPEGFSGNVQSVWTFKPSANLTAQYGKALACFYVQQPVQSEDPLTHTTIQGYKSLTYNPVEINIAETLNPIPDGELDPESPLLEQILAAITYYNTYLTDIEENGVSTVYDTEGEPQREVHTDAEATEDSNNLITSDGVYKAVQGAKDYADTVSEEAEESAKSAAQGYATAAENNAKAYTDAVVRNLPVSEAQQQAIDEAEQRAKEAAQGYADTAEENAKEHADTVAASEAADALVEAKAYTNEQIGERVGATIRVNTEGADETHAVSDITFKQGDGFPPEENPVVEIPLQYNRLNEIDNTLTSNSTFSDVVDKMYKNSVLRVSPVRTLQKPDGGQSDYFLRNLIPQKAEGVDGLLEIRKHNTHLSNVGQYYYTDVLNVEARYKEKKHLFGFERLKSSLASIGFKGQLVVNDKAYEGDGYQGVKIKDLTDLNSAEYTIDVPPVDPGRTVFVSGGNFHKFVSYNNLVYFIGYWQAVGSKVGLFTIDADDNISFVLDISQYVNVEENVHPMAIVDDTLYVGSYGEKVAVVDLLNNTVTGITKPTNEPTYAISAKGNTVAMVSNASSILTLYDISEQQFSEVTMPVQMTTMYSIAVYQSDDAIFVCNRDIYCYKNNEFTLIASDFLLFCGTMLGDTLFLCNTNVQRYTQMAKLDLTNDEFNYIIFPATPYSDPRVIRGILAYNGKVYMTDYESYYLVDPPIDIYDGIFDETGIKWQKQASDNDVKAVAESLNTAVEQFQEAIEDMGEELTTAQEDIDDIDDGFSSFVKANNEEETSGLTYTYDNTTGAAVCTGGAVSGGVHIPCYTKHEGKWYKVIDIAQNAFKDNTGIQAVYFPQTIEHIGVSAFENCTGLTLIRFKPSVGYGKAQIETIENSAFKGCSSLATIDGFDGNSIIVSGLLYIGVSAFQGCALTSLTISAPKVVLGASAFMNCTALTTISIDYFVSAGANVFSGCTNLSTVDITNDKSATVTVPSGATVNYYRRGKNPVRKYLHSYKVHSTTAPTSSDPYKMEVEIVIVSERDTAYTTVAQILADSTKMYISANGYGLVYTSTQTNVCPISKVDDTSNAIGIAVFKDNPQSSILNIYLNDNSAGYAFNDTVMSLE